jgi:hypothetical protein
MVISLRVNKMSATMKKHVFKLTGSLTGLFLMFLAFTALSHAEPPPQLLPQQPHFPIRPLLPDLSVQDIWLTPDCRVAVRIRNNGPGQLPDKVWNDHQPKSAGVYLTINGNKWGGGTIWLFDPARALKTPGGTAEYISNLKVSSLSQVKAEVDIWNDVAETNESNNSLTKNLGCNTVPGPGPVGPIGPGPVGPIGPGPVGPIGPGPVGPIGPGPVGPIGPGPVGPIPPFLRPDLSVQDVWLTPDCRVAVRIRNNGPGVVPDNVWTNHQPNSAGVYLTINGNKWGGASIWLFDPGRALKAPGGTAEYVSNLKVTSPSQVKAEVDIWNVVAETNESNNWMQRNLACVVPGPGPGPGPGGPGPGGPGPGGPGFGLPGDLQVKITGCPIKVRAGQDLGASFQVWAKSSFNVPVNNVTFDLVLLSAPVYPVPAPYANYSPSYSNGVLLKGGRENESFPPQGIIKVKLNGSNTIPANTPPGTYYLAAVVDAGNKVHETKEFNNVAYCKVKVLPPFFPVQPVRPWPPLQPVQPPPLQPVQPQLPPVQPMNPVIQEDCIPFNPANIEVRLIGGRWKIVEGSHWIFDFDTRKDEAYTAFNIIRHYGMNSTCYVGRPDPSFTYMLVNGSAPQGPFPGEDAIAFNPNTIEVKEFAGRWKIVDGSHWMFDFGANKNEAVMAYNIIKKYGFRYSCFVGRPNASFIYMRK